MKLVLFDWKETLTLKHWNSLSNRFAKQEEIHCVATCRTQLASPKSVQQAWMNFRKACPSCVCNKKIMGRPNHQSSFGKPAKSHDDSLYWLEGLRLQLLAFLLHLDDSWVQQIKMVVMITIHNICHELSKALLDEWTTLKTWHFLSSQSVSWEPIWILNQLTSCGGPCGGSDPH